MKFIFPESLRRISPWWVAAALLFLVLLPYWNALGNAFLWDDEVLIVNNALLRSWTNLGIIFQSALFEGRGNFYRPLPVVTFLADYQIFGLDSWGFHLMQNLWHGGITLAFFFLLRRHFSLSISFFAALLYGMHPVHASQVLSLSGRTGILEGLWLLSLLCFREVATRPKFFAPALAFFALALLAKESALLFPLLCAGYAYFYFQGRERTRLFYAAGALAVVGAVYVVARFIWLPFAVENALSLIAQQPLHIRLWTSFSAILQYFGLILFPWNLRTERHFIEASFFSLSSWAGLLLVAALLAAAFKLRRSRPGLSFGIFWFFLLLAACVNFVPLASTMAEHWLYLPLLGIAWALADTLMRAQRIRADQWGLALALVAALYGTRTAMRTFDYRDGFTLYRTDLEKSPNSFTLQTNLGVEYFRRGELLPAKEHFQAALKIMPTYAVAASNLGVIHERAGEFGEAQRLYLLAIHYARYSMAYKNLARLFRHQNRGVEADNILKAARRIYPYDPEFRPGVL